jgi:protein gp37
MNQWNPWHGCHKLSAGCKNCYVYRIDARHERDASVVTRTLNFDLPVKRSRNGAYKLPGGQTVYTCFSSDFFLDDADEWRIEAWNMIRQRSDIDFFIITKRIHRFGVNLPADWGSGYPNVTICSTCETQDRADYRLPLFVKLPIRHKLIVCEPLLEKINLSEWLANDIRQVVVGGESGTEARECNYNWVLDIREQCLQKGVPFHFKQTGARFIKNGRLYRIPRHFQHRQAAKAGIDFLL